MMQANPRWTLLALAICAITSWTSLALADEPEFSTVIGTVERFEKEMLTLSIGEKDKKSIELRVTGTSRFHVLAPQQRSGKTVVTQRSAESGDVAHGQHIAIIYTSVDGEHILLTAVIKAIDKEKK